MAEARTHTHDVVVVGGGGAGLAAAIEARSLGRSVALLEKRDVLGGTTALSVGSITATCTPHQLAKGIKDSPAHHFDDMPGFAGALANRDNAALRRLLTENVPETFRWLLGLGLVFYGPMPEPPHRKPRMHTVLPNSRAYIYRLARRARALGVDVFTGARAEALAQHDGRVTGVVARLGGARETFAALGGVVLASGDYSASAELKARYMDPQVAKVDPINPASTGDGHALALALGARVVNGELSLGPEIRFVPPARETLVRRLPPHRALAQLIAWAMDHMPERLLRPLVMSFVTTWLAPSPRLFAEGAVLVNREGRRFADERDAPALALPDQPGKVGYILFDAALAQKFSAWPYFVSTAPGVAYAYLADYRRNRKDIFHEASTLAGLADRLGMDGTRLEATVAEYNAQGGRPPITAAPFTALGPVRSAIIFTDGGLAVSERLEVLGADDRPIPGLYAAGATGQGGLLLEGHGHHLGWAFTSGRIAARHAAWNVVTADLAPDP